ETGDGQNQRDEGHQQEEGFRELPAQGVEAASAWLEIKSRQIRTLAIVGRGRSHPLLKLRSEFGLRLGQRDSGTKPSHYLQPVVITIKVIRLPESEGVGCAQRDLR